MTPRPTSWCCIRTAWSGRNRVPTAVKANAEIVSLEERRAAARRVPAFPGMPGLAGRPVTDGAEGLRVLRVLDACERSLANGAVHMEASGARSA